MPKIVAVKEVRYAGVSHLPGAEFEASDKDARLLVAIGKAALTRAPNKTDLPEPAEVAEEPAPLDEVADLRAEYTEQFGKRPFMGWSADELRERMGKYLRRDMRPED